MDASNPSNPNPRRNTLRRRRRERGTEAYWISLAAREDCAPFAENRKGAIVPNASGKALAAAWRELRKRHASLVGDIMAVGPHSLHGILFISHRGTENLTLPEAVRLFKAISGRKLLQLAPADETPPRGRLDEAIARVPALWKRGYTERPLHGPKELASARKALKAGLDLHPERATG
jgi:hypothetical protein